jgi:hypothetical protein
MTGTASAHITGVPGTQQVKEACGYVNIFGEDEDEHRPRGATEASGPSSTGWSA